MKAKASHLLTQVFGSSNKKSTLSSSTPFLDKMNKEPAYWILKLAKNSKNYQVYGTSERTEGTSLKGRRTSMLIGKAALEDALFRSDVAGITGGGIQPKKLVKHLSTMRSIMLNKSQEWIAAFIGGETENPKGMLPVGGIDVIMDVLEKTFTKR